MRPPAAGPGVRAGLAAAGAIVGGLIVVTGPQSAPDWQAWAVVGTLAVAGLAAPSADRWAGTGITSGWALAAATGLFLGVPETDHVQGVIAVLLIVWLVELFGLTRVGGWFVAGLDAVLVWSAARGAAGIGGALVAGLACLGMLVMMAPASWLPRPRREVMPTAWRAPALMALQLGFVIGVARIGGVRTTVSEALVVSGAALVVLLVVAWVIMSPAPS